MERPKLYCPLSPDSEVDACDYDLETRACSEVCLSQNRGEDDGLERHSKKTNATQ